MIEILVTVGLLSFIMLGLLAMFNQTQKAFRGSMKQTDVLGAGRAITDMLARELSQMTPSQMPRTTNFLVQVDPRFSNQPLLQGLPGAPLGPGLQDRRTNVVQWFFFLSLVNQDWVGTGYGVVPEYNNGVGTLYRWTGAARNTGANQLSRDFINAIFYATNMSRIADGVVHLRIRPFATNGFPVMGVPSPPPTPLPPVFYRQDHYTNGTVIVKNSLGYGDRDLTDQVNCYFVSNAVPAYVELELGILEANIAERAKSIPSPTPPLPAVAARDYLSNHVAQVHLFRQRIPIRNVDYNAYQ